MNNKINTIMSVKFKKLIFVGILSITMFVSSLLPVYASDSAEWVTYYNDDRINQKTYVCSLIPYNGVHGAKLTQNTDISNVFVYLEGVTNNCNISLSRNDTKMHRLNSPIYFTVTHIAQNMYKDMFLVSSMSLAGNTAYRTQGVIWY